MQWKWHKTSECHYGYLVSYYTFCNAHLVAKLMLDSLIKRSVPFLALCQGPVVRATPVPIVCSEPFLTVSMDRAVGLGSLNRESAVNGRFDF